VREHLGSVARAQAERTLAEVELDDELGDHLHAVAERLLPHPVHEGGPADRLGEAREVLDVGGQHQLPAGQVDPDRLALEDHRVEVRAAGVDGGRPGRRAGADDDERMRADVVRRHVHAQEWAGGSPAVSRCAFPKSSRSKKPTDASPFAAPSNRSAGPPGRPPGQRGVDGDRAQRGVHVDPSPMP
jgi:hypothetical protein